MFHTMQSSITYSLVHSMRVAESTAVDWIGNEKVKPTLSPPLAPADLRVVAMCVNRSTARPWRSSRGTGAAISFLIVRPEAPSNSTDTTRKLVPPTSMAQNCGGVMERVDTVTYGGSAAVMG